MNIAHAETSTLLPFATGLTTHATAPPHPVRLMAEAALFTAIGAGLTLGADLAEAGLLTVFLATAALDGRMRQLLAAQPTRGHRRTVLGVAALFVGIAMAFAIAALCLESGALPDRFGAVLAGQADGHILSRRFDLGVGALLQHNLGTMATLCVLAFVYRSLGALLALAYNAAIWSVVLTTLIVGGIGQSALPAPAFVLGALAAVLPHLLVETLGYVFAALAAHAASRATTDRAARRPALRNAAILAALAIANLVVAAVLEDRFAPLMLDLLR